jgi:hypothetical protein
MFVRSVAMKTEDETMADLPRQVGMYANQSKAMDGRQSYFVDVAGKANTKDLSVVSFEATERMGEPYRITIILAQPDRLSRSDDLGKDAVFSIVHEDAAPRKYSGCIIRFSKTRTRRHSGSEGLQSFGTPTPVLPQSDFKASDFYSFTR